MLDDPVVQAGDLLERIGAEHILAGNDDRLEEPVGQWGSGRSVLGKMMIHP